MRIPFKIDTHEFTMATSYEEMSIGEFFAFQSPAVCEGGYAEVLSALSGIKKSVCENVSFESVECLFKPNAEGWYPLKYLREKVNIGAKMPMPSFYSICGKDVPVDRLAPSVKQKELMQHAMNRSDRNIDASTKLLAIYYQPIVTGEPLSVDAVNAFHPHAKATRLYDALPIAINIIQNLLIEKLNKK